LRYRNGYVTGIVATRRLDRFLTYGVIDQRFARETWYAVPRRLSGELRRLTVGLRHFASPAQGSRSRSDSVELDALRDVASELERDVCRFARLGVQGFVLTSLL
jgi:hypothetical protein